MHDEAVRFFFFNSSLMIPFTFSWFIFSYFLICRVCDPFPVFLVFSYSTLLFCSSVSRMETKSINTPNACTMIIYLSDGLSKIAMNLMEKHKSEGDMITNKLTWSDKQKRHTHRYSRLCSNCSAERIPNIPWQSTEKTKILFFSHPLFRV